MTTKDMTICERLSSPCDDEPKKAAVGGTGRVTRTRRTPRKHHNDVRPLRRPIMMRLKLSSMINILIAILSSALSMLLVSDPGRVGAINLADATSAGASSQLFQRPDPSGRPQLMVAVYCPPLLPTTTTSSSTRKSSSSSSSSLQQQQQQQQQLYYNQYLDVESRKWRSDRQNAEAFCKRDKQAILAYCKRVYPTHDIRNIVESSRPYKLDNWCRVGASGPKRRACHSRLTVRPYRCLEGAFQSDALLVPERCVFDHVHNKSVCESSDVWNKSASEICHGKSMRLQSSGMLQPCGLDVFSGVEFVCCPMGSQSSSSTTSTTTTTEGSSSSFAQAAAMAEANEIKTSHDDDPLPPPPPPPPQESAAKSAENSATEEDEDEDEYDEETSDDSAEDVYDDDGSSWAGDKSSTTSTTTSTTTTTTTTTTERPVERYFSHFDLAHEHDDFRRAELAVQASYQDKITRVMREWSALDGRYEDMKRKGDLRAAEEFKRKMTHQFQKTVEALEQESAAQRHQLVSMHAERAMTVINRRKQASMDCLQQALNRVPARTRQVERCSARLLRALEKDRTHTLRQYRNLLNLNTREALRERKIILEHLVTLNRAVSQSIAMLDRSPELVRKLKGKIVALWHKLRGVSLDEPIVQESEEKALDQLEEEAAQRKIERERKRLAEQEQIATSSTAAPVAEAVSSEAPVASSSTSTSTTTTSTSTSTTSTTTSKPQEAESVKLLDQSLPLVQVASTSDSSEMSNSKDGATRTHYQHAEPVGFAHLRMEAPYHELSYSVRQVGGGGGEQHGHMKLGYTTMLASSFAAVILLAFLGVKYYGKNSTRAYRRQGFAEVGRSCPEEKSVTHMQFNGYENPAYKLFEAEA